MINLYFTNDEMIDFLQKRGYNIKTVKTWTSYNTYHNQVENSYKEEVIALRGELAEMNDPNGAYRDISVEKYKLKSVFTNVLKLTLLNL